MNPCKEYENLMYFGDEWSTKDTPFDATDVTYATTLLLNLNTDWIDNNNNRKNNNNIIFIFKRTAL